jgi:hypothetical protein
MRPSFPRRRESSNAGKYSSDAILNQNPIFEMVSKLLFRKAVMKNLVFRFAA